MSPKAHSRPLPKSSGLAGDSVAALAFDSAGTLWVGTSQGLSCRRSERLVKLPAGRQAGGDFHSYVGDAARWDACGLVAKGVVSCGERKVGGMDET